MVSAIVIDDDPDMVDVIADYIENCEVNVVGVGYDGYDASVLYEKLRPDVVLLDMEMPNFDGRFAIDNIKKIDSDARIIIVSGFLDKYQFRKNEVSYVLRKPFEIKELMQAINDVVG